MLAQELNKQWKGINTQIDLEKEVPHLDGTAAVTGLQEINEEEDTEHQASYYRNN